MAAKFPALVNAQHLQITGPKDLFGYKAVVQVQLNGGAVTLTPLCFMQDTSGLTVADGDGIEYNRPNATSTKLTAPITASGIYEFYLDGKVLDLAVSGVAGAPLVYYSIVRA